jgi:hypothetical protein
VDAFVAAITGRVIERASPSTRTQLRTGNWLLVTGFWFLVFGFWFLVLALLLF